MIKVLLLILISSTCFAQSVDNPYGNDQNSLKVYDADGRYRGNLNTNQYDPNSVSNPYGRYGNQYSNDSINNKYNSNTNSDNEN